MRLFVYGTLKSGQRNHGRFCRGVLLVEPAQVLGRLYQLPVGYPMLVVPVSHVVAKGTADYVHDEQLELSLCRESFLPSQAVPRGGDWERIEGEILTFDDAAIRLPKLDRLEQFVPGGECFYDRVLVRPQPPANGVVWTYIAAAGGLPESARRIGCRWS